LDEGTGGVKLEDQGQEKLGWKQLGRGKGGPTTDNDWKATGKVARRKGPVNGKTKELPKIILGMNKGKLRKEPRHFHKGERTSPE